MSFAGRVFVVTGGSSGVGRATVKKLLQSSAIVHAIDKAASIPNDSSSGGTLFTYPGVDISSREQMESIFDKISDQSQTLNGLAHCAAILAPTQSSAESDLDLQRLWQVNTFGTWITSTEFYRCLQKSPGWGSGAFSASIVNVGSMASLRGIPHLAGYVTSKHAVLGMTRSFALEWGKDGVRVNCVAPGEIRTPMSAGITEEDRQQSPYRGVLKSVAEPGEIADTILYLLSNQSSNISAQIIESNGGWA